MNREVYRFDFDFRLPMKDVEESLHLAEIVTECLHGRSAVMLDACVKLDQNKRTCIVDAKTDIGYTIARLFTEFLCREFGVRAFAVEHMVDLHPESAKLKEAPCPGEAPF